MKMSLKPLKKLSLETGLIFLALVCIVLMFKTSNEPLVAWLEGSTVGAWLFRFQTGNDVAFNLSASFVSAILMYFVLVKIPELKKRRRAKAHLLKTYDQFKEECIAIFVGLADGHYSLEIINDLKDLNSFKEYFKAPNHHGEDRWDAAVNRMNDYSWRQLTVEMEILYHELQYFMTVTDVRDDELYSFVKDLGTELYKSRLWHKDYDGLKSTMRFFWAVLAGWSFAEGGTTNDRVREKLDMI